MRFLLCLLALTATSSLAQTTAAPNATPPSPTSEVLAQENLFWTNYTSGNTGGLAKQFAPDFKSVEEQIWSGDQVLSFVKTFFAHCSLAPVKPIEPVVTLLPNDVAIVTYTATETPACGTQSMSGETSISSVWIKSNGTWLLHLHTEYAIPPK